jgi:hypothetical protein
MDFAKMPYSQRNANKKNGMQIHGMQAARIMALACLFAPASNVQQFH